jgi:hypothetical protein
MKNVKLYPVKSIVRRSNNNARIINKFFKWNHQIYSNDVKVKWKKNYDLFYIKAR